MVLTFLCRTQREGDQSSSQSLVLIDLGRPPYPRNTLGGMMDHLEKQMEDQPGLVDNTVVSRHLAREKFKLKCTIGGNHRWGPRYHRYIRCMI